MVRKHDDNEEEEERRSRCVFVCRQECVQRNLMTITATDTKSKAPLR